MSTRVLEMSWTHLDSPNKTFFLNKLQIVTNHFPLLEVKKAQDILLHMYLTLTVSAQQI